MSDHGRPTYYGSSSERLSEARPSELERVEMIREYNLGKRKYDDRCELQAHELEWLLDLAEDAIRGGL